MILTLISLLIIITIMIAILNKLSEHKTFCNKTLEQGQMYQIDT